MILELNSQQQQARNLTGLAGMALRFLLTAFPVFSDNGLKLLKLKVSEMTPQAETRGQGRGM